jgi:acyl transferase domain-containing protein
MTIETGCSSSLVALNQACQALIMGDCSTAIVAGSNLIFTPTVGMHGSGLSVFSPSGISKCFDASADGYGRGEAVNAVCIKRLDDALRDGDQIRAVIRSSMVNHDGRSPGITTPSAEAQERLIRETYRRALISDLSQTAFVECHGTGTLAGDPIECSAIAKTFLGEIYIGSVCVYPAPVITYRQESADSFIIRSKPMLVTLKGHQDSRALSRLSSLWRKG